MIEGMQVQLTTEQVAEILRERIRAYTEKADWYANQAEEWKKINAEVDVHEKPQTAAHMEEKAQAGREVVKYTKFLLEHLIPDQTYRLGLEDLRTIGVLTGYSRYL